MENWKKARGGDETATLAILERTEKSIYAAIHKYAFKPCDTEELYSQGVLLVLECIGEYRPETGVPFLAYVHTRLKYHYLRTRGEKRSLSLDVPIHGEDDTCLADRLVAEEDTEEAFFEKTRRIHVQKALEMLTERERKCVTGFYYHHLSLGEIAASLGIAYRTAYNNKNRGLKKLKQYLADYAEDYGKERGK